MTKLAKSVYKKFSAYKNMFKIVKIKAEERRRLGALKQLTLDHQTLIADDVMSEIL